MKKIILIIMLFVSQNLLAYKMYSEINFSLTSGLTKNLVIECSPVDQFCKKTCGNSLVCSIPESICVDCASQKNHEMNMVYSSKASDYYQSKDLVVSDDIISYFLANKKIMTVSYDLFLNYYTPELSNEISIVFNSICKNNSNQNMMLAEIDSETMNIQSIPAVVCIDTDKNAEIHELTFNPMYSTEKNYFWQALQAESELAYKRMGLKLTLSRKLN